MLSTCKRDKSFNKEFMETGDFIGYKCFDELKNIRYVKLSLHEESFRLGVCFKDAFENSTSLYNKLLTENFVLINNCLIQCSFKLDDQPNLDKARDLLQLIHEHYNYSFPGVILQDMHNYTGMKFKVPKLLDLCISKLGDKGQVKKCLEDKNLPIDIRDMISVKYADVINLEVPGENNTQISR